MVVVNGWGALGAEEMDFLIYTSHIAPYFC